MLVSAVSVTGCEVRDRVFSTKVEDNCEKYTSIDYIFRNLVKPLLATVFLI